MAGKLEVTWRFYLVAAAVATLVLVPLVWFMRLPEAPASPHAGTVTHGAETIAFAPLQGATGDEARLRDPMPLFLPTPLNAAQEVRPERVLREPGDSFARYEPKFVFDVNAAEFTLPTVVRLPEAPADAIRSSDWQAPFYGLGRAEPKAPVLPARAGFVEVRQAISGQVVAAQALEKLDVPASDWAPAEYSIMVDAGGIVGGPSLCRSSGSETVDMFFQDFLLTQWRVGERLSKLSPGAYRVFVGL